MKKVFRVPKQRTKARTNDALTDVSLDRLKHQQKTIPKLLQESSINLTHWQRLHIVKLTTDQLDKFFICFETF